MPKGPAARTTDPVIHLTPGTLMPGPGSVNVLIGKLPAWRGLPAAAAGALQAAKAASDARVASYEAAGPPTSETGKATEAATMSAMITGMAGGADIHTCVHMAPVPVPPPHGPGVVVDGSQTVLINNLPACRMGDTIVEAFGPPNKIMMGLPTVIIGG